MAKFAIPTDENTELGGSLKELEGELVALQSLGNTVTIGTTYGPQQALRVQVVDPLTGSDLGVRLMFWSSMQAQLTGTHTKGLDWLVGVIVQKPQQKDPSKTVYLVEQPDFDPDWNAVEAGIDMFEATQIAAAQPTRQTALAVTTDEEAPF